MASSATTATDKATPATTTTTTTTTSPPPPPPHRKEAPVRKGRYAGLRNGVNNVNNNNVKGEEDILVVSNNETPLKSKEKRKHARVINRIPEELIHNEQLDKDIQVLPSNYNFEIRKTIHRIHTLKAKKVGLQMPEGLLMYASTISDILIQHTQHKIETIIFGDVTYGACCIDDYTGKKLNCDLIIHYGHSCLISIQSCFIPILYVFVHISFDPSHFLQCLKHHFHPKKKIILIGTIQFVNTLHAIKPNLAAHFHNIHIPQNRPLSPGELLGCTSPLFTKNNMKMNDADGDTDDDDLVMVYVGDGRFHLESAMIANPTVPAYQYNPYSKKFTMEYYDQQKMRKNRQDAIQQSKSALRFGIIFGTLGRQGSSNILKRLCKTIRQLDKFYAVILLSEITPKKIMSMENSQVIDAWIQIACPRLSIDWGHTYGSKPLLTPYEAFVALGQIPWRQQYPMDYYSKNGGIWTNYYKESKQVSDRRK